MALWDDVEWIFAVLNSLLWDEVRRKSSLMGTMFAIIVDDRKFSSILIIVENENVYVRLDVAEDKNRILQVR